MQAAEEPTATATALIERAARGDTTAILELGRTGDHSVVGLLRAVEQSSGDKRFGTSAGSAQMALAKLGEGPELEEIMKELASDDPHIQYGAMRKLKYVGGKRAIHALAGLLKATEWRTPKARGGQRVTPGNVFIEPPAVLSAEILAEMVPNGPTHPGQFPARGDVRRWQEWWEAHKHEFE